MKKIWMVGYKGQEYDDFDASVGFFNEADARRVAEEDGLDVEELEVHGRVPDGVEVLTLDLQPDGTTAERTRIHRGWEWSGLRPELKVDHDQWYPAPEATMTSSGRLIGTVASFPYALSFPSRKPVRLLLKVTGTDHEAVRREYAECLAVRKAEAAW